MSILLQVVWTGLAASTYAMLFAVAFSLVLKVIRFWNFAQSGLMALSFYGMYMAHSWMQLPLVISVLIGLAITIVTSLAMELYALKTLRARNSPNLTFFIFALVVSQFLAYLLQMIFGTEPLAVTQTGLSGVETVKGIVITYWDMQAFIITAVLLALLYLFIGKTRDGQFLAAVADNADLSRLYGIDVKRAHLITFVIASILITAGMYLFGTRATITPNAPFHMMLFAAISTLLGGIGRIFGAALAAGGLSLIQGLSVLVMPSEWQGLILYIFLFVAILLFPQGIKLKSKAGR